MNFELTGIENRMIVTFRECSADFKNLENLKANAYKMAELMPKLLEIIDKMDEQHKAIKDAGVAAINLHKNEKRRQRNLKHDRYQNQNDW